ncbi:MAG: peroxiredoxin [Thermoleophilia bacterium]|nr:peroxiredoxin [Thermoleophilia bacterium]
MNRVVVNLTAGPADEEASTIAYLVATAAQDAGKDVLFFMTKEAVRLGFEGGTDGVQDEGRPSLAALSRQFADNGGTIYLCPVCVRSRHLDETTLISNASILGAAALWEWVGDGATTFTY